MTSRMTRRAASLMLALLLLLSLSACSEAPEEAVDSQTQNTGASSPALQTESAQTAPRAGTLEVRNLTMLPNESVFGLCRDGDGAAVLLIRWDEPAQCWHDRLVLLDPQTASVSRVVELDPFVGEINASVLEVSEEEIRLVNPSEERCAAFDRSGRFLGLKDHPVMSPENLGWQNRLLNDNCFRKEQGFAEFNRGDSGSLNRVVAFYDETDRVHVLEEPYDMIRAVSGHRLLTLCIEEDCQNLALLDLDEACCLDRLTLSPDRAAGEEWVNLNDAVLAEDWVLLSVSRDWPEETRPGLLFWYPESGKQTPLTGEVLTEQTLTDRIAVLGQKLEAEGMVLHLDEAPAKEQTPTTGLSVFESTCQTGASLFGQYWILTMLTDFVQKLPAGMIRELTTDLPGGEPSDLGSLHIYIVRNIPGDAAAFANAWMEPVMVCFATEEFGATHPAHEFMHILDLRLGLYLDSQRRDLEGEWWDLSPVYAYDSILTDEQYEAVEPYFVSAYARTNSTEDRAETFEAMFDTDVPAEEAWWYKDHPGVQKKAAWLAQTIRSAFPSVQATDRAWWETLPDTD